MTWTAPRTWLAGEVVTAALMNQQIRDNMLVLATTPNLQTFTANGNFAKAADAKWFIVEGWAGGGGSGAAGGASSPAQAAGGGGGGGGYFLKLYVASDLSASEPVTVGAAGTGTGVNGNTGGTTTFKALTATGGTGGASMAGGTTDQTAANGVGGTASGGNRNLTGSDGGKGQRIGSSALFTNVGGKAGGPGGGSVTTASVAGIGKTGLGPGGGASGSWAAATGFFGGDGAAGRVIVTYYFS